MLIWLALRVDPLPLMLIPPLEPLAAAIYAAVHDTDPALLIVRLPVPESPTYKVELLFQVEFCSIDGDRAGRSGTITDERGVTSRVTIRHAPAVADHQAARAGITDI